MLRLIEDLPVVPSKYFKKLINTDDIWEIRIKSGNDIFRLLGFFDGPKLIVLDHAFQKKNTKNSTPSNKNGGGKKTRLLRKEVM